MYGVMAREKCCSGIRSLDLTPCRTTSYVSTWDGTNRCCSLDGGRRAPGGCESSWVGDSADNIFRISAKRDFLKKTVTPHMIGSYGGVFFARDLENALLAAIILLNKPLLRKELMAIRHFQGY